MIEILGWALGFGLIFILFRLSMFMWKLWQQRDIIKILYKSNRHNPEAFQHTLKLMQNAFKLK